MKAGSKSGPGPALPGSRNPEGATYGGQRFRPSPSPLPVPPFSGVCLEGVCGSWNTEPRLH